MAYNNNNERSNEAIEFKIVEKIGVLTTFQTGWTKEINIVSWNNSVPKYDIRDWSPDHDRMTKGITLYESEAKKLGAVLTKYFANRPSGESKVPEHRNDSEDALAEEESKSA